MKPIASNVIGVILAALFALITYNDVLITDLGLNDKAMAILRLVAYLGSAVVGLYNGQQIYLKRKND